MYPRVPDTDSDEASLQHSSNPDLYQKLRLATFVKSNSSPKWKRSKPCTSILRDFVVYTLALWGFFSIAIQVVNLRAHHIHSHGSNVQAEKPQSCNCGNSITEAIALGCKFDSLSMAWLPEHCRDDDLTAEFETAGDGPNGTWLYYADTEHTSLLDAETVAAMGDDPLARVHMGTAWHRVHCVFYWRKLFRTRFNGKIVEARSDTESHIMHCGKVFENPGYGTISGVSLETDEEDDE